MGVRIFLPSVVSSVIHGKLERDRGVTLNLACREKGGNVKGAA